MKLTEEQKNQLKDIWFIYGNNGKKHTLSGHKYIQKLLDQGEDYRSFYKPSKELIKLVDSILKSV